VSPNRRSRSLFLPFCPAISKTGKVSPLFFPGIRADFASPKKRILETGTDADIAIIDPTHRAYIVGLDRTPRVFAY